MNDLIEFSRPVDVLRLTLERQRFEIAASAEECAALVQRFGLLSLDRLEAKVRVIPLAGGFYRLQASFVASLVQACVVTLEPVPAMIDEDFSLLYGPVDGETDLVLDAETETVEPLDGGMIDIGEAVAQQLSLALDPFPRMPETAAKSTVTAAGGPGLDTPFAALAKLRKGP